MNDNDNTGEENVIDFTAARKGVKQDAPKPTLKPRVASGKWEFHLHPASAEASALPEVVSAEGYLKFGPQFIAIVEGPEDDSTILGVVALPLVRYVKRLGDLEEVQGTLAL